MKHWMFGSLVAAGIVAALVGVGGTRVAAHHGWSGNEGAEFELTGTVERALSLAGPHATMQIKVGTQVWDLTLAPPGRTSASGLKEGLIPVGATVKAHGHRNRDPKRFEVKTERLTWNNKVYAVYPDRD
jgi:hypothetical protein